jgi:hypothetical protein
MNQMIRGSQLMSENQMVGEFSPCIIKFPGNGITSQLSYGNQFGFKPGTAIGKRSVDQTGTYFQFCGEGMKNIIIHIFNNLNK